MLRYSRWNIIITLLVAILKVIELYAVYPCTVTIAHYSKGIQLRLPETLPIPQCLVIKAISFPRSKQEQEEQNLIKDSWGLFHLIIHICLIISIILSI